MSRTELHVFKELLKTDFIIFKQVFFDKLINFMIWTICLVMVNAYLMPFFGLPKLYANFILAGICAAGGLFEVFPSTVTLITDFEGDNITSYYLTLPLRPTFVWIRLLIYYAVSSASLSIFVLPVGKLLLWDQFSLSTIHIPAFALMFILANLFYGALTLWLASKVKNMTKISNVWMRFIFPMWFLGGFQFSWATLNTISPALGYISLINPMIYIMEGFRAAILGQAGYLPLWVCAIMLTIGCVILTANSIYRLRKRLDFI